MSANEAVGGGAGASAGFELGLRGRRALLTVHLVLASMATGASASILVLLHSSRLSSKAGALVALNDLLLTPASLGFFVTGLMFALLTRWGFFRARWITFKWLVVAALAIGVPWWLTPSLASVAAALDVHGHTALANDEASAALTDAQTSAAVILIAFVLAIVISVFKPGRPPGAAATGVSRGLQVVGMLVILLLCALIAAQVTSVAAGRRLPVVAIDVARVTDGEYVGEASYAGFTYRAGVRVDGGRILAVTVLQNRSSHYARLAEGATAKVLAAQSTCVDVVSGASTTSRALTAAMANALADGLPPVDSRGSPPSAVPRCADP